jgi:hypothetical protein
MNADDERLRRILATIKILASEFCRLASRPRAVLGTLSLAICVAGLACSAVKADCRYGDSSEPERAEIKQADGELYMCVSGTWIRDKDILAVVNVERANLWTDCCGSTDETDYVRAACDERRECSLPATQSWAGAEFDPARRKHLWVRYHCAIGPKDLPTEHYAQQAEENVPLKLSCEALNDRRVTIVSPGFDDRGYHLHQSVAGPQPPPPAAPPAPLPAAPAPK